MYEHLGYRLIDPQMFPDKVPVIPELQERLDRDLGIIDVMSARLTTHRQDQVIPVEDVDPAVYDSYSNSYTDPTSDIFSLGFSVLKQTGFDIIFTTPAFSMTGEIIDANVGIMVNHEHRTAFQNAIWRFQPYFTDKDELGTRPAQACVDTVLDGTLCSITAISDTVRASVANAFGDEFLARAILTSVLYRQRMNRRFGIGNNRGIVAYRDITSSHPDATPLSIEELSGMLAGVTQTYLAANPQYHPRNL